MDQNPATILIVEDNLLTLLDARIALEDAGFVVIEATDAMQALDHLRDRPEIAAVLTDVKMPGAIDGNALAHRVRAEHPAMPLVMVTGAPEELVPPAGALLVTKPYRTRQLIEAITARASTDA